MDDQVKVPRQDSSGTLKTTIHLGRNPSVIQKGPFYLCKDLPGKTNSKTKSNSLLSTLTLSLSLTKSKSNSKSNSKSKRVSLTLSKVTNY